MRITEGQLRRIIRQEVASLREAMGRAPRYPEGGSRAEIAAWEEANTAYKAEKAGGWVINLFPSRAEAKMQGVSFPFFTASHFTPEEKAELKSVIASLGPSAKMTFTPGEGAGGVGSVGIRGITFPSQQDATDAANNVISMLSKPLAKRLAPGRPRIAPRKWGG